MNDVKSRDICRDRITGLLSFAGRRMVRLCRVLFGLVVFLALTTCYPPFTQNYQIRSFRIANAQEVLGDDEPYIWVWALRVDANAYVAADYVYTIPAFTFPNLVAEPVANQWYRVNPRVGSFSFPVVMVGGVALTGLLAIVWEKDETPTEKVVEAYRSVTARIQQFIAGRIAQAEFSNLSREARARLRQEIRQTVRQIFAEAVDLFEPLSWNVDDNIGTIEIIQFHEGYPTKQTTSIIDLEYEGTFRTALYQFEVVYDE